MFASDSIYIQVFAKRFVVTNVEANKTIEVSRNHAHPSPRMLVGDFTAAQLQLKDAVKEVRRGFLAPKILIHPMELIEGGVTQVEYRVFVELGLGAGASKAAVYSGPSLSGSAVEKAIRDYKH